MHIEITYADGMTETIPVTLEGERVLRGSDWVPGHAVASPQRCYFDGKFFEMAIDEAECREGREAPDEEENEGYFEPFDWKLVGQEANECRAMLVAWRNAVGPSFDPTAESVPDADDVTAEGYRRDRQCWMTYLNDPTAELVLAMEPESVAPRF